MSDSKIDEPKQKFNFIDYIVDFFKVIFVQLYRREYNFLAPFYRTKRYDTVIIAKHNNNIINYLKCFPDEKIGVITNNKSFEKYLKTYDNLEKQIWYNEYGLLSAIKQIIMILQTNKVVIDDYYAPLFALDDSKEVWNIWHSYAIYKKIGLDSPHYAKKSNLTLSRYKRNYKRINKLFVRSIIEKQIFLEAYKISEDRIIIDERFYKSQYVDFAEDKKLKRVVYAPTFRPYAYDFIKVINILKNKYPDHEIYTSFHPLTLRDFPKLREYQAREPIMELMKDAEIFISDYSGLLIEIADLCPDITVYQVIDDKDYKYYCINNGLNTDKYKENFNKINIRP